MHLKTFGWEALRGSLLINETTVIYSWIFITMRSDNKTVCCGAWFWQSAVAEFSYLAGYQLFKKWSVIDPLSSLLYLHLPFPVHFPFRLQSPAPVMSPTTSHSQPNPQTHALRFSFDYLTVHDAGNDVDKSNS